MTEERLNLPSGYQARFNRVSQTDKVVDYLLTLSAWSSVGGWLSKTDATEHVYGSSGRGSPHAVNILGALYTLGLIERRVSGRRTYYHVPAALCPLARAHPRFSQEHFDLEIKFMRDGSRPVPKGAVLP